MKRLATVGLLLAMSSAVNAEVVPLDPAGAAGDLVVIESVAPLGTPLTYVGGGDGLIGVADMWPTLPDTPANRAFAANAADHTWLQYDPEIVWSSPSPLSKVFAVPGVDHDPLAGEALEFIIDAWDGSSWVAGGIEAIYRDGFDTADTVVGHSDDYTSLWSWGFSSTLFRARSGDLVEGFESPFEGEIDALVVPAAVPEPATALLVAVGALGWFGYGRRRRG